MTREFYRKAIVIREFMIQCEAWFATWNTSYPWISSFISWNPQDFPETFYTRREIWSFAFPIRDAWIFLKILALNPFRIMSLTLSHLTQKLTLLWISLFFESESRQINNFQSMRRYLSTRHRSVSLRGGQIWWT